MSPRFFLTSPLWQLKVKSCRPVVTKCGEPCILHVACVYLSVVRSTIISIQDCFVNNNFQICLFCQPWFPDMIVLSTMLLMHDWAVNNYFHAWLSCQSWFHFMIVSSTTISIYDCAVNHAFHAWLSCQHHDFYAWLNCQPWFSFMIVLLTEMKLNVHVVVKGETTTITS
jgi:hypothetical protein